MTNSIDEAEVTEVFLLTGTNTTENHPVISNAIKRAITQKGAKLIVAEPRRIDMVRFADVFLQIKPGTDEVWINGLMHVIIKEDLYDKEYVENRTEDFDKLKEAVLKYDPEYVEKTAGISKNDLIEAARMFANAKPGAIYYAMGITQHTSGTNNVKSLANLAMLCGNVGVEGGGVNPLRGQNNVQGACDMGCLPNVYPGYQKVDVEEVAAKFSGAWNSAVSKSPGMTITDMFKGIEEGKVKSLYIMGENPMVSDPDIAHIEKDLKELDLLIVQDIFRTETAELAHVILPTASFAEKEGTFTNTERRVQRVRKAVDAPGESKDDWEIVAMLSTKMGYEMNYKSAEEVFTEITQVTPSYAGISYSRIENEGGLQWPCPTSDHPGTKFLHKDQFSRGKGLFHAIDYKPSAELPDDEYPLILTTGRVLQHYHTGSMTRRTEGLNELYPGGLIEISPADAEKLSIRDADKVKVSSRRGSIELPASVTTRSQEGVVFIPFHFAEAAANMLTNTEFDPTAKIPELKVCAVRVEK